MHNGDGGVPRTTDGMEPDEGSPEWMGRVSETVGTDGEDSLRRSLAFLDWERTSEDIVALGNRAGTIAGFVSIVPSVILFGPIAGLLIGLFLALAVVHSTHRCPVWLATLRRTRALGAAPGLVGRIVLRMRLDPSTERAVRFSAGTGDGPLATALSRHERRRVDGPTSGLRGFAREWRDWFPAIERSAALVRTAAAAPPERRGRCLDRALDAVVSGTTDRLATFVGAVRGPVSALYAFGVLLPLALIALLPAAAASGVPIRPRTVATMYLVVLPGGLIVAAGWLLSRRPVAFPPPTIRGTHPDVPKRWPLAVVAGACSAALAGSLAWWIVADWSAPVAAFGVGCGVAMVVFAVPRRRILTHVRDVERDLPDAMTIIGGDVAEGVAVERAVANAGERLDGATGTLFARAARRSNTLRVGVRQAFRGRGGPVETVPSPRVHGAVHLLAIAAREGRPAGDVLLDLADQLERLRQLERDSRRQLATVTGTLMNTAAVFAPLVGGATVALATGIDVGADGLNGGGFGGMTGSDGIGGQSTTGAGSGATPEGGNPSWDASSDHGARDASGGTVGLTVPVLGRIVGVYVTILTIVLTALATGLERGFDMTLVAYRVGIALPTATVTYLVAFLGAGLLL